MQWAVWITLSDGTQSRYGVYDSWTHAKAIAWAVGGVVEFGGFRAMTERQQWARRNQGWALTRDIEEQARKFDWDGDWPEVDTDGHLTGEVVEPGGSDQWTVVDVMQSPIGRPYVQEGFGASMAVVSTADLQTRRAIETAAPSPGSVIGSVEIEQGHNSDWYVRVHLRSTDAAKLVAFLERMKAEG